MTDRAVQFLGFGSALLTAASFFPQALKVLRTNETRGISLRMYLLFSLGVLGQFDYLSCNGGNP